MKNTYGLLIDYEYCTGCQSCEVACKEAHGYPVGKWGIRVYDDGPWEIEGGLKSSDPKIYNWNKIPVPTDLCDLCVARTAQDKDPLCVHHCLANVMQYGSIAELAPKLAEKTKQVLFVPQYKPLKAKGKFVPVNKFKEGRKRSVAMEIETVEHFETSTHRSDSRMDVGMDEAKN